MALLFLANGLSHPSLWPRLPELRDAVGATDATLGLALVGTGVGGVLGALLAPAVARRLGPQRAATWMAVALAVAAIGAGLAPSVVALFAAFALMGLTDGVADISQNHLLFEAQRTGPRSVASRMHAVWSVGALLGTAAGTLAATVGVGVAAQTAGLAVVATVLAGVAARTLGELGLRRPRGDLPGGGGGAATATVGAGPVAPASPAARAPAPRRAGGRLRLWALVVVAGVVAAVVESVANEWSALTLRDGLGADVAVAGAGPTGFAAAMLVGRLAGDRIIDRLGAARTAALGGGAVALGAGGGLAAAAATSSPWPLLAGLAVAGVGTATLFPLMLQAGDQLDATGRGVAAASAAARVGLIATPLAVGAVSQQAGPLVAFVALPVAGLAAALVLPAALRGRR